ncbi:hypothetical protein ACO0K9_13895 [Undibacterium sp. Ji50W]|uniref:hypothetical protein n=1 Tax=Undibacterium sp. Ji50W TaxID=3413041 RepID=UPI003BF3F8B0
MKYFAFLILATVLTCTTLAQETTKIYAQHLVDLELIQHTQVAALTIYATVPKSLKKSAVASAGSMTDQAISVPELDSMSDTQLTQRISSGGKHLHTILPLLDVSGETIGTVVITLPYKSGDDSSALYKQSEQIRDELRRHVINVANLMDPVPYVANFPNSPYAQKLVDETMARHPELLVLAMHVATLSGDDYPIIASSIGRIGKKADSDDRQVIETGKSIYGAYGVSKTRFGIELPMFDITGKLIGALSVGYSYKTGDDQEALLKQAQHVEAELRAKIPSLSTLHNSID